MNLEAFVFLVLCADVELVLDKHPVPARDFSTLLASFLCIPGPSAGHT